MSIFHPSQGRRRQASSDLHRLLLLAALLTSLLLRVYRLGAESLWYDETVSAYLARQLPGEIVRHTAGDIHPPAYYLMLHAWQLISRPTLNHGLEYLLGWASVAWGVLIAALLYPLGRRLLDRRSALIAVWLAAVNPFHIWYSQEVRMYAMGSALGLLCLWAAQKWLDTRGWRAWAWAALYMIAAAVGLYTLYYFALLLVALNAIILWLIWKERQHAQGNGDRSWVGWLAAQAAILFLFAPWLPTLWRQAVDPPVPPWRVPWQSIPDFVNTLGESLSALLVGQTPPVSTPWPWAVLVLIAVILFVWRPGRQRSRLFWPRLVLLTYIFLPVALLYLLTATVTPLYHVRYLFLYAPPFLLILAAVVTDLYANSRGLGIAAGAILMAVSIAALQQFWFNPVYQSDDHRRAVAELSDNWRPGDLILVNAGWAYTALDTYWPQQPDDLRGSIAPPLAGIQRFHRLPASTVTNGPVVAVTGSVDGDESLGWGNAASDFFAISTDETVETMKALAQRYGRIWHYRIYDTVSDPAAVIRGQLAAEGELRSETNYPGRDYLQVQLFETAAFSEEPIGGEDAPESPVDFGDVLRLTSSSTPETADPGQHLYVDLVWQPLPGLASIATDLSMSLRLYDAQGTLVSQQDASPSVQTGAWLPDRPVRQPLALPLPASTKPGVYSLELVVYGQDDGVPLSLPDGPRSVQGQRWQLAAVQVRPPGGTPPPVRSLARFDYIELIDAVVPLTATTGREALLDLIWRARSSPYRDNYSAIFTLHSEDGEAVQTWVRPLGGDDYPSASWQAETMVRDLHRLSVAPDLPPATYMLTLSVERTSDAKPIPAGMGWLPLSSGEIMLGQLTILENSVPN